MYLECCRTENVAREKSEVAELTSASACVRSFVHCGLLNPGTENLTTHARSQPREATNSA